MQSFPPKKRMTNFENKIDIDLQQFIKVNKEISEINTRCKDFAMNDEVNERFQNAHRRLNLCLTIQEFNSHFDSFRDHITNIANI